MGKALHNYRYKNRKHALDVPCIGIGSWKHTAGTEQLNGISKIVLDVALEKENRSMSASRQNTIEAIHMVRLMGKFYVKQRHCFCWVNRTLLMSIAFVRIIRNNRRKVDGI